MTMNQVDRTVVTSEPAAAATPEAPPTGTVQTPVRTESRSTSTYRPGGPELTRRIVVLLFGLVQVVIGLRFVLLLLDAREANALVSGILDISQLFVGPFEGILRTDALRASGSIFDLTAIVAFVGWTILELIVLWVVGVFRREPA
ncbi:MAG TPA: hypothetical protein VLS28_04490 [Candidatus Sulfomarinibacteraceae bacterium]|nr:hypothetical protein [Candidatus Sulfomarinibacteraceae bacterium]